MADETPLIPETPSAEAYENSPPQDDSEFYSTDEPFSLFADWLRVAKDKEPNDPNAMALATADASGMPDVRMVLLKDVSPAGFTFYTNTASRKGVQLAENSQAALCFHWKSLRRQVRISGISSLVPDDEADAYFASRAKDSQIGAWASDQSQPMDGRFDLEGRIAKYAAKYGVGKTPRPPHWSGYRIAPIRIEFWRDRPFRLHDRLVFERSDGSSPWTTSRLFP